MRRTIDPGCRDEDWLGNNIAFPCPVCGKLYIVSGLLTNGHRECPRCAESVGTVKGGRKSGGTVIIEAQTIKMTELHAAQIAALINERNRLADPYTALGILRSAGNYHYELNEEKVVACVELKRVQWYQSEIRHLSVDKSWEGKRLALAVYSRAEEFAHKTRTSLIQCTIREDNTRSIHFFQRCGFSKVGVFRNDLTRNTIGVWQKVLEPSST